MTQYYFKILKEQNNKKIKIDKDMRKSSLKTGKQKYYKKISELNEAN